MSAEATDLCAGMTTVVGFMKNFFADFSLCANSRIFSTYLDAIFSYR